jgi:4-amino-4-deoxy-L-arabinose transferase-like glycosyltransferase
MAEEVEAIPHRSRVVANNSPHWRWHRWHLWVLIVGLIIRLGFCLTVDRESSFGGWDGKEYHAYAQSLLALEWDYPRYFNNIRPPFYPIFLMPFVAVNDHIVWHIQVAQSLLGVLQAFVLAKIVGRWAGQRAGSLAFLLILFHPFLIYNSAFVLTETLFITLLWVGIACLQRMSEAQTNTRWPLICGALALGLACLTRPALQPFLIVAVIWIGWRAMRMSNRLIALRRMALFTAVVSGIILPFMFANMWAHREFSLAPGGLRTAYALSNSPEYLRMYEAKTKEEYYETFGRLVARFSVESGTPPETWMEEARAFRQNHRSDWWRLQWYKFKHFWTPWLNPLIFSRANFLISLVTLTPVFLLAAAELWRRRGKYDPFLLLLLGLVGIGYLVGGFLFHVQVRYRFPFVDMTFLLLTASFLAHVKLRKITDWLGTRRFALMQNSSARSYLSASCQTVRGS